MECLVDVGDEIVGCHHPAVQYLVGLLHAASCGSGIDGVAQLIKVTSPHAPAQLAHLPRVAQYLGRVGIRVMARHVLYEEVCSRQLERVMGIVTEHLLQLRTVFTRKPEGFLQPGVVIAAATGSCHKQQQEEQHGSGTSIHK